ncbi:MAG: bestrophin family ion channel [Planctomycetota bacterium]
MHDLHVGILEGSLGAMTDVQGRCERIKNTPIPFTYHVLLHRIVAVVFCLALPFGLFEIAGNLTPVVVCMISYAFFGLDSIGDEVEQPFETDDNDLPLAAICRTIEIDLLQMIREDAVQEPLQPVHGVLS